MIANKLNNSLLHIDKIESRDYQIDIAHKCVNKNSLIVIPTGLGKTIIALLIAAETLRLYPNDSKVLILAPTRPLINQHYNSFMDLMTIPEDQFCILTGMILPKKRKRLFHNSRILFFTPQTLRNDLVNKRYSLEDVCLIIFDEIHRGTGDYPYTMIADKYVEQNPDGNILGLTASPGSSQTKIQQLCSTMHIPMENTHFRTRKDSDVKKYIKPMDIFKISVEQTSLMESCYNVLKALIEERLHYLLHLGFLEVESEDLFKKVIRKDLLRLNKELVSIINSSGDKTGVYSAISVNAQALILYHMLELIEQQGLDNLLGYLEKLYKDALKQSSSKAVKVLSTERKLHNIFLELKKNQALAPENLIHPKYRILQKVLNDEIKRNKDSRILVFVKFRVSVKNIVNRLKHVELIKPVRFVGQTTKSKDDKGMSQKRQIEVLDKFKDGSFNVLVATNVGEEGLDIAECDMVVFYDVVASEIRFIQRKGRTARHRQGKVVILFTKGTNDEIYMRIVMNKLKKMNFNLKNPEELKNSHSERFNVESNNHQIKKSEEDQRKRLIKPKSQGYHKKKKPLNRQSNLISFVNNEKFKKINRTLNVKSKSLISISNELPMKLGLRKRLREEKIEFQVVNSSIHIKIKDKIVVQIYDPALLSENSLVDQIKFHNKMDQKYQLVIQIFDFIDFKEKFENEKHLLKKKIKDFGNKHDIRLISIENSEELCLIVKNIYETQSQELK